MKNRILLLLSAIMLSLTLHAQTNISTNISSNTTLTVANSPYVVTNSIVVNAGITLTVENGVEIRFNSGVYLQVRGTLSATGAKFTANGSTTPGSWDGLYVSYESYENGSITLDNCIVEYASNLYVRKGQLTLNNSSINNFSEYGVQISSSGILNIENTTITNTDFPVYFYGAGKLNAGDNVVLTGNANDYVYLNFSSISNEFHLNNLNIPYYNTYKNITETGSLIIDPGVRLEMMNTSLSVSGKIKALGTDANPVVFDKHPDASYWLGLDISASSIDTACIFRNCIFKNASYDSEAYSAIEINNASPTIDNCKFTGNCRNLIITGLSYTGFSNCTFGPSIVSNGECYNIAMDLNAQPVFTSDSIQFNSQEIRAIKIRDADVTDDSHLKKISFIGLENITYCLYGDANVVESASLVIDPGIVIKCRSYTSLITGNGAITGIGTVSEPIVFTYIADDNYGNPRDSQNDGEQNISHGYSGRIFLNSTATSKIENWKILYAGGYYYNDYAVHVTHGNIIKGCEVANSYYGVLFGNDAQVINNSFLNIDYYPVARMVNKGLPVLLGNTISNVGNIGILIAGFDNDSPTLKSMDFAGFTNVAYIIESQIAIAVGNVVTINPGVVIKFSSGGNLVVNGGLKAVGKVGSKIIFTSINDDSAAGDTNNDGTGSTPGNSDWQGIGFSATADDSNNLLKNCEIRYVTNDYSSSRGAIRINSCRVVVDSIKVNFSNSCAFAILGDANPEISNCQFYNINDAPVFMDLFSNPVFSGNNQLANLLYTGIRLHGQEIKGIVPVRSFAGYDTITYIVEEIMTVRDQLIIPAGLTFKGNGRWDIRGKLDIQGTAQKQVVFTTIEDDAFGNPKDLQQNGNTSAGNNGNYVIFYDEANDNSLIDHALFRYSTQIPVQLTNASPKIQNSTFENTAYEGISLSGSSTPSIEGCIFNNIAFPFETSLVTYPASTSGNTISGTTGRAIRVKDETLTNDVILTKRDFAGIENIPYVFRNYTVGTGAKLTISPGIIAKFMQNGYLRIQNGLLAVGGNTPDSTIVFTSDRDDFYGGDTYEDGDANQPSLNYWYGIYFYNSAIDENCILKNCVLKNGSYYAYANYSGNRGAITLDNASPTIQNCLFRDDWFGILSINTSLPKITNCDFIGTEPTNGYGVLNMTSTNTVTAQNCWWNSNTGPRHSSNPAGLGERVSDYVVFVPFATQLAKPVLGDVSLNGKISPYDASLILQHTVSNIVLTAIQQGVSDVSGNGSITSYDASLILQYCVGLISLFEPGGAKSGLTEDLASVSFSDLIVNEGKNTFAIPAILSTSSTIKSLEMKYAFDQHHIRFLKTGSEQLPSGISVATGCNMEKGEIAISLASAYDLELNNTAITLEFELIEPSVDHSTLSLVSALANEYKLIGTPVSLPVYSSNITLGMEVHSENSLPEIFYGNRTLNVRFLLFKPDQKIDIQTVDLSGKTIFRRIMKGLDSGYYSFEFPFPDRGNEDAGIYIIKLRIDDLNYSKKILIR